MRRQIGSLNRSPSYPFNLQRHSPNISLSDFTPYLVPSYTNKSPSMNSDETLPQTKIFTQFHNLTTLILKPQMNLQTSPSNLFPPPFQPLHTQFLDEPFPDPFSTLMQPQFSPQGLATHLTSLAPLMKNSRMN